jgi:hypothetical protein
MDSYRKHYIKILLSVAAIVTFSAVFHLGTIGYTDFPSDESVQITTLRQEIAMMTLNPTAPMLRTYSPTNVATSSLAPTVGFAQVSLPNTVNNHPVQFDDIRLTKCPISQRPLLSEVISESKSIENCLDTANNNVSVDEIPPMFQNHSVFSLGEAGNQQLCNRMGILTGGLTHPSVRSGKLLLALGARTSSDVFFALDLQKIVSVIQGLLLFCIGCSGIPNTLRCHFLLAQGKYYNVTNRLWTVGEGVRPWSMFLNTRPRHRGYQPEMATEIFPRNDLVSWVVNLLAPFIQSNQRNDRVSIGIHRRFMDGLCYDLMQKVEYHHCFASEVLRQNAIAVMRLAANKSFAASSDEYERQASLAHTCNYTLSNLQMVYLNRSWPGLFRHGKVSLFFADDNQAPLGAAAIRQSGSAAEITDLVKLGLPSCVQANSRLFMLADMVAMVLTDYHMGNVMSSCDYIVAHWRRSMNKSLGTSHPRSCYDGFYG